MVWDMNITSDGVINGSLLGCVIYMYFYMLLAKGGILTKPLVSLPSWYNRTFIFVHVP